MMRHPFVLIASTIAVLALSMGLARSQQSLPPTQEAQQATVSVRPDFGESVGGGRPGRFMQVPVSHLYPGAVPSGPAIVNPVQGDPHAAERGMRYFINFNCVGCHASNGGGGMGPALSNNTFIYGGQPENIYLSIYQGRPHGMPAWGAVLPDTVIWDLVTYIGKISNEPNREWGRTFAASPLSPQIEQVPSEQIVTTEPWSYTGPFKLGQKP
jgi:cytochrome c oxidase cbb3-type subunit 3